MDLKAVICKSKLELPTNENYASCLHNVLTKVLVGKKEDKVWKILYFNLKTYLITVTNYSRLTDIKTFLCRKRFLLLPFKLNMTYLSQFPPFKINIIHIVLFKLLSYSSM